MQQWEYLSARAHNTGDKSGEMTISLGYGEPEVPYAEIIHTFDTLGREGWELVSAYYVSPDAEAGMQVSEGLRPTGVIFWFKRPLRSSVESGTEKRTLKRSRRAGARKTS